MCPFDVCYLSLFLLNQEVGLNFDQRSLLHTKFGDQTFSFSNLEVLEKKHFYMWLKLILLLEIVNFCDFQVKAELLYLTFSLKTARLVCINFIN